jgi:hypothetical protein
MVPRSIVVAVIIILSSLPAAAQPSVTFPLYSDAVIQEWESEFRGMVSDNWRLMLNNLDADEARKLRQLKWEFPTEATEVLLHFRTFPDGRVLMPVASLLFLKDLANAEAWLTVNGYASQSVLDYVTIIRMDRLSQWPVRDRLPINALGVPASATNDARVLERRNETLSKSILFVMGHEIGHHLQGFGSFAPQESEMKADAIAVDMFRRIGLIPSGSNFFFVILSRLSAFRFEFPSDEKWQDYQKKRTHPLDATRIANVADLIKMQRNSFASALPNAAAGASRVDYVVEELNKLAKLVDDRNLGGLQVAWGKTLEPQDLLPRKTPQPILRPKAAELAATGPFAGHFQGELRPTGSGNNSHSIELLFHPRAGVSISAELMMSGIRGACSGKLGDGGRADLIMEVGGDRYQLALEMSPDGRAITGRYESRDTPSVQGQLRLTRSTRVQ